ncbi:rho GTPase-activating protein 5-like [Heracleum sosnowskyi]|uniref:Rho GTPase-activating protein 5-like n=1 Tax=Heracleum sosnowskyi TaxID=360622 RepID=A0AAD8JMM6_9APIA|nr:rho GTPase-activating protein 5-like [Heracleum sosnowskyi]
MKRGNRGVVTMDIGAPTNVRHVTHVTFDRFNGFVGLPLEFEPQVPRKPPSASSSVFGVSTESMQLSFDSRGNSVPTILLMMQRRLYEQGGLQAEGIFRINGDNGQQESTREQLNMGLVPYNIDVHSLACLIKAWFRELPNGLLDALAPEQVMQAQSEEDFSQLVRLLPPTEAALLDWAVNLMADVVEMEYFNKMNARNVALVFAPNMTRMADPLTALMYAVKVMNFLKTLVENTMRDREDFVVETGPAYDSEPSDETDHNHRSLRSMIEIENEMNELEDVMINKEPLYDSSARPSSIDSEPETKKHHASIIRTNSKAKSGGGQEKMKTEMRRVRYCESCVKKRDGKGNEHSEIRLTGSKSRRAVTTSHYNSRTERNVAWR